MNLKPPAFQFYASDFIGGTKFFSADETGAYIRLLCEQWDSGKIENNPKILKKICGISYKKLSKVLLKFKITSDGFLSNSRLEHEREKQLIYRELQRINGLKGGRPIKGSLSQPIRVAEGKPNPTANPNESSSSSSSFSLKTTLSGKPDERGLFKDESPPKTKLVPKTDIQFIGEYYRAKFEAHTGNPLVVQWGKIGKLINSLLVDLKTKEKIVDLIDVFFKLPDDEFLEKAGRDFGIFYSQINKLNGKCGGKDSLRIETKGVNFG